MKVKKTPSEIWSEYQSAVGYNTRISLYETVERNNNFYNDKQWEGVNAPDLDKPVFNFLKSVVNYYIAMIISDDIAADVEVMHPKGKRPDEDVGRVISREIADIMERENMQFKNRRAIRNAAVDGDCCFYNWFDPEAETGQAYTGQIRTDLVDNTNVLFGNPSDADVQAQPYVLVVYRRATESVREEAEENGVRREDIVPDSECLYMNEDKDSDNHYTTVILKMWKEKKRDTKTGKTAVRVHMTKTTKDAVLKKEWDTGYRLYPVSYMSWEAVKNSYHGVSPLTGKIQNQIFVNKLYAMAMMFTTKMAFPKLLYDATKIPQGWDNRIGSAIRVIGNPNDALFANFASADMSASVPKLISNTIAHTKEMLGANETALGNVKPENTSAIIALQKSASMQLDMQRMDFYNCVEETIRSYVDMMRVHYGERAVRTKDADGKEAAGEFDFGRLEDCAVNLKIDVGKASYWSEIMQIQTLDNLMSKKIIPDAVTYLENLPEGYLKNKQEIIRRVREMQESGGIPGMAMPGMTSAAGIGKTGMPAVGKAAAGLPLPGGMQAVQTPDGKMRMTDAEMAQAVKLLKNLGPQALGILQKMGIDEDSRQQIEGILKGGE